MKTKREKNFEERKKSDGKTIKITIINRKRIEDKVLKIAKPFYNIDTALHKLRLDIMTNAHYGFTEPIEIFVTVENG